MISSSGLYETAKILFVICVIVWIILIVVISIQVSKEDIEMNTFYQALVIIGMAMLLTVLLLLPLIVYGLWFRVGDYMMEKYIQKYQKYSKK